MSETTTLAGQLALDFTPPPPPPAPARPQPPKRPCALAITAQRARTERVLRATEAKIRAVPKKQRRAWIAHDFAGIEIGTRLDRMLADVPDLAIIGRWIERPTNEDEWDAMRAHDIPHGACMYRRCHKTGHFVLIADWHAVGHFEERLDA